MLINVKDDGQAGKGETPFQFVLSPGKTAASISFLQVSLSVCVFVCLSVYLSVPLFVCQSIHLFISLSMDVSVFGLL